MNQGFLIARTKRADTFFTSTSSYDRPQWLLINEATVYPSAEIAQQAVNKLWKNGSYSASVVPLSEEMQMDPIKPDELADEQFPEERPEDQMQAGTIEDTPDEISLDDDEVESLDNDDVPEDDIGERFGSDLDREHSDRFPEENEQSFLSPLEQTVHKGQRPTPSKISKFGESAYPTSHKNQSEAKPSENKTTAADLPKPSTVKFKQTVGTPSDVNFGTELDRLDNPNKTPDNIITLLKNGIKEFNTAADYNNGKDDAQASMALTIASAMEDILADLQQGTIEGLKQAQIRITTYWNGITTNFPPEVIDYLYKSGRQPMNLKNVFYDKWDSLKKTD